MGFGVLGAALVWSRLAPLDQSLWWDEIYTVVHYVRPGPEEIFLGDYVPNNHMLFSALTWLTSSILGESEIVYRLWSVVPFLAGVALGTAWLRCRHGTLAAALYLFLAAQSPVLLELSPQARGYGLAFLAMSVLVVAGSEAYGSDRRLPVAAFCAAGIVGTWTLPVFALAFGATSVVLLTSPQVRRRLLPWLGASVVAVVAWYVPVLDGLASSSQQESGTQLPWHAPLTAPIRHLLLHSISPGQKPVIAIVGAYLVFGVLLAAGMRSAFARSRPMLAVLVGAVLTTYLVLTVARFFVLERFASFLLVPLLMLVALGLASVLLAAVEDRRPARVLVAAMSGVLLVWFGIAFVDSTLKTIRNPIEEYKGVAAAIATRPAADRVVVNLWAPDALRYYLDRPIEAPSPARVQSTVCTRGERGLVYVENGYRTTDVDLTCLEGTGATRRRFRQRCRTERIDVWFVGADQEGATEPNPPEIDEPAEDGAPACLSG